MKTKKSRKLTLQDRLSQLTFPSACKLLGRQGKQLIQEGGKFNIDVGRDVSLIGDLLRVNVRGLGPANPPAVATITMIAAAKNRLYFNCTGCSPPCKHIGAALSLVLEDKLSLGLSSEPPDPVVMERLSEEALVEEALAQRAERARAEKFYLRSSDRRRPWADYTVTSAGTGKTYRVALRGEDRGMSFCSCPDFRTNTLGTCKHVMYALSRVRRKFSDDARRRAFRDPETCVHVAYGQTMSLHLRLRHDAQPAIAKAAAGLANGPIADVAKLVRCIARLEDLGEPVTVYPDAEELIDKRLFASRIEARVAEIRSDPAGHPLRKELLKTELLPYQLDGIAFAAGAGRAILADDMGLGKTIQGIGLAELLAREAPIRRVLVVTPASVKFQWRAEIHRFSDRDVQLILGRSDQRADQYRNDCFFTICNYEQVLRDVTLIEQVPWDLIILDEGQRIKNWEGKTARVIKALKSPFALVLSGTPLENRLDELYSVVQFIDDRRLPPAFRFFHRHREVDERGKVLGYKNLDEVRANLKDVLLRRTRQSVLAELPPRTTDIIRVPPTQEQVDLHDAQMQVAARIAAKAFLTEMDLLRLQKALLACRMAADSTFLVDKQPPGYSTKLERLEELLEQLFAESDRKIVLFSEWTTMLGLIEPMATARGVRYVRLDGSVPQQKRLQLVRQFQEEADCRLFMTTNAGSTGLNLQAANTVINVDLPWNPAVLEQRIGRAHRMGQKQPVHVLILVTERTIEENMLATLAAKHDLALAVLDADSDVTQVKLSSGIEELRRRLEVLMGAKPEAPLDESNLEESKLDESNRSENALPAASEDGETMAGDLHRQRVSAAGGELLGAAFKFLNELVSRNGAPEPSEQVVSQLSSRLTACVDEEPSGAARLTISLPDKGALHELSRTLARLLVAAEPQAAKQEPERLP